MPPSWLQKISDHHAKAGLLPELENADWTRALGTGDTGYDAMGAAAASSSSSVFVEGLLSTSNIALHGEISVLAVEPVLGYLAVGTSVGGIHLFGKAAVQIDWSLRPANKVQHLLFKSGSPLLIAIDIKDNISIFDLSRNDPQARAKVSAAPHPFQPTPSTSVGAGPSGPLHPDTPMRIGAHSARNSVLCAETSPLHNHLFLGLRDGTIDAYDLERLSPSPYRVPNLWWEEEEILRKSGVPDAPNRRHVPLVIDIKTHPKDLNQLLLAYEGGVVLLDVTKRTILRSFQLRHLPGASGAGVGDPNMIWTERAAPATCVAWRPDGLVFACGHEDGCISFWHIEDDEKPITVRTLETLNVDRSDTAMLDVPGGLPQSREPVFKLAWSGFPAQSWADMAQHAKDRATESFPQSPQSPPQTQAKDREEPATGTVLTVLGGATERQPPGLVCLHFPAFSWPYTSYWNSKTPEALAKTKQALRASLDETKGSRYSTPSPVEDFILLPRDNPYYSLAYDPVAVITLLAPDPALPPLPPPAAARGLKAFAFPPPAEARDVLGSPASPGSRKGEQGTQLPFAQRALNLPLALSTAGSGAILGAKLIDVTPHAHRSLTAQSDASNEEPVDSPSLGFGAASASSVPHTAKNDLQLRGGKAAPTASGTTAGSGEAFATMARAERWRLLITWHQDGTVRFHDASPQLLLLGIAQAAMANAQDGTRAFTPGFLEKPFPCPLPHLTIDTKKLINARGMVGHPLFEKLKADSRRVRIADVCFAPEALEAAIALRTGQVMHFKFGFGRYSQQDDVREAVAEEVQQDEERAASMARTSVHMSPMSSGFHSNELDQAMAGAMHDMHVNSNAPQIPQTSLSPGQHPAHYHPMSPSSSSSRSGASTPMSPHGSAPPRPRRDPKRNSMMQRNVATSAYQEEDRMSSALGLADHHSQSAGHGGLMPPFNGAHPPPPTHHVHVDEITQVGHLATWRSDGFKPNIIVELNRGEVTAFDVSDIGFMAIACGPSLAVVDLRGPELLVREGFGGNPGSPDAREQSRQERKMVEEESKSSVQNLRFSICRTTNNPVLSPTLITVRENGYTTFWTFSKSSLDLWLCERTGGTAIPELPRGSGVQVVDMAGNVCRASPGELQRSMREQARGGPGGVVDTNADMNLMLCYGWNTISLRAGLSGPRVAKVDLNEPVKGAAVIDRRGDKVCLAVTTKSLWLYSLPHLRPIVRVQRHNRAHEERLSIANASISLDGSGDFVEVANSLDVCMWTVFATMPRPGLPDMLLYSPPSMPMAPNMLGSVATSVVNWIGGKSTALTQGAQLDEILAGGSAKRASLPKGLPEPKHVQDKVNDQQRRAAVQEELSRRAETKQQLSQHPATGASKSSLTAQQTTGAADQAAWSLDLAKQRGEMMTSLEQGLSNLERGASDWMRNARQEMVKQAAKDKLTKFF